MTIDPETVLTLAIAVPMAWIGTVFVTWVETRRRWIDRLAASEHRAEALGARAIELVEGRRHLGAQVVDLALENDELRLERDMRRPPSPIVEHLALQGQATIGELTEIFGPFTGRKLLELQEAQEVQCDRVGVWRWVPPGRRLCLAQPDPTETVEGPRWLPPPPEHRLEVVS